MSEIILRPLDRIQSAGGVLNIINSDTGEIIGGVIAPSGRHLVRTFMRELPDGCHFSPDQNISVERRRTVGVDTRVLDMAESSANPIWHPSPMTRQEKMLAERLKRVDVIERRMRMRERALMRAEATSQEVLAARLAEIDASKAEIESAVEDVHAKAEAQAEDALSTK